MTVPETIGLVLEGGGMRGVYTGGVLEQFLANGLFFPYTIGVSAGACNAVSYLSRQRGRNRRVTIDFLGPEYLGLGNWLRSGSVFGMDYIFGRIPNELDLLDYERLFSIKETFVIGAADPETGESVYYGNEEWSRSREMFLSILKASSSLPFFAPPVSVGGRLLFDGGVTDPIPVRRALADGCSRLVVVLTKDKDYRIKPFKQRRLASWVYRRYPKLVEAMAQRERVYNDTMALIRQLESEGRAFVIQPSRRMAVGRMEKNKDLLVQLYELGEADAKEAYPKLNEWWKGKAPKPD